MNTKSRIEVAAASVIGREHRRLDRPCQDAYAIRRRGDTVVAALCDGCGSGAHSELGARLGANLFTSALLRRLGDGDGEVADPAVWRAACDDVLARLAELAPELDPDLTVAISRHLLFTLLAVAVTPAGAAYLAIGDGVIAIDGVVTVMSAPDDAPAYLGYELVRGPAPLEVRPLGDATAIAIASDGAAPLADALRVACADDRLFANPDALRRRLALASRETVDVDWHEQRLVRGGGLLADDATVVLVRWGAR